MRTSNVVLFVWSSFLFLQCTDGASSLSQKLPLLTLSTANFFFVVLVFFANHRCLLTISLTFLVVWFSLETQVPMALTNSLFIIHPIMLYVSLALIFRNVQRRRLERNFYGTGFLLFCAITLGGFWSMQELNWGGWWNWDVLELGALHTWIVAWVSTHLFNQKSSKLGDFKKYSALCLAGAYYLLNKSGFATSIHSFVTSPSLKLNVLSAVVTLLIILTFGPAAVTAAVCLTGFTYSGVIEANALKVVLLWVSVLFIFLRRNTRPRHTAAHRNTTRIAALFLMFNFNNSAVSLIDATAVSGSCVLIGERLALSVFKNIFIWDAGWFSKPKVTVGSEITFGQSRSLNGNATVLVYRK